jgi:hypothetical protein
MSRSRSKSGRVRACTHPSSRDKGG